MSVPPESGGYYGYSPSNEVVPTPGSSGEQKRCTVRGCRLFIDANSTNKMCESCRGKHRIYASTKRAKRKLEKAAVSELVPIEHAPESVSWMSHGDEMQSDGPPQSFTDAYHSTAEPRLSPPPVSPSHHHHHWTGTIDPRLFPTSNSSSELAGALTLPPTFVRPAPTVAHDAVEPPPAKRQRTISPEPEIAQPSSSETGRTDLPSRFCSVKGCRLIIAASYPYKMCEPCRNRYRHYGITKRRKWKAERAAFEQELDNLLEAEEVKRHAMGLPPLADSPDDLFKWQQTVVDEKVSLPENISTMAAAYPDVPNDTPPITPTVLTAHVSHPFDNPLNLPPHMCTVSHCHKILPGSYQYKRCEQHRVQNRHHSELKRVREKVVKATGPPEGSVGETFEMGRDDVSMKDEAQPDWSPPPQPRGKKKKTTKQVSPEELRESTSLDYEDEFIKEKERAERKHRTWCCTAPGCHNIIPPTTRWRMCDPCRGARKALQAKRKAQMEQELLEAEEAWQRANGGQPSSSTLVPTPQTPSMDGPAQNGGATSGSGLGDVPMQVDVDQHAPPAEQLEALPPPEERPLPPPPPAEIPTPTPAPEPKQSAGNSQSQAEGANTGFVAPSLLSGKPNSHMSENATGYEAVALTTTFTPSISQSEKVSQTPKSRPSDLPMSIDTAASNSASAPISKKKGRPRSQRAGKITSAATVPASASPEPTTIPPSNAQASTSKPVPPPPHPSTPTSASTPPYPPTPYSYAGHPYQYPYYSSPYGLPPPYAIPSGSSDPTRPPMPSDPHGHQDPYSVPPPSYPPYSYPYPYTPYQQQYTYSNYYSPYAPSPYASRYPYSYPPPPPPSQIKRRNRKKASEKDTSTVGTSAQSKDPTPPREDNAHLTSDRQQEAPPSSAVPDPAPASDVAVVRTPRAPSPKPPCPDEQNAMIQTRLASLNEVASTTLQPAQFSFNPDTLKFRPSSYSAMVPPASTGNRPTASQTTSFIPYNPENPKRARYHAGKRPVMDFSNLPETTHRSYQSQFTLKLLPKPIAEPSSFVVGDLLRARVASNLVDAMPVTAPERSSTAGASTGDKPIIVAPLSSEVSPPPSKEATLIATQPSPEMIIDVTPPSSQPPSTSTLPSRESSTVEPPTAEAIPDSEPSGSKAQNTTVADSEASQSQRICGTKSCQRTIASDILGGLCGRCRAKMKKHQINAKQRFKLEPKQSILARVQAQVQEGSVKEGRGEDGH